MLNHEGNVADCAGVAGLAALAHFKRPDVSLEGDIVKVSIDFGRSLEQNRDIVRATSRLNNNLKYLYHVLGSFY